MVSPKLRRHLTEKNTWSDRGSIRGHRNLNCTERSVIAPYRNFNAPKICKITVCCLTDTHRSLSLERWSPDSNEKGSPTFPVSSAASCLRTNGTPLQSTEWRPRDRKWFSHSSSALEKSGKQWRQKKLSFFLRGECWATARCRFRRTRRNTDVQDSGHSDDLIFG